MHPILFDFGFFQIRFYGLMYVLAIMAGTYLIRSEVKRKNIPLTPDNVLNAIIGAMVSGIIAARIYYVLFNWNYYAAYPLEIPALWHGGLASHGGFLGGFLFTLYYLKRKNAPVWKTSDAIAPAMVLGTAFVRFGNFMNGEAHGIPTTLPWGMIFPASSAAGSQFPDTPVHPTMLYEMTADIFIFALLWLGLRRRHYKDGFIFALYIILYSIARFFVEGLRADSLMLGPIRIAQAWSIMLIIAAAGIMINRRLWKPE